MPTEDKSDLLKIAKYKCEVSEGSEALGKLRTYIWYIPIL